MNNLDYFYYYLLLLLCLLYKSLINDSFPLYFYCSTLNWLHNTPFLSFLIKTGDNLKVKVKMKWAKIIN